MKANEYQVDGTHYQQEGTIQHWDFAASQDFDYFQGQITKYVTRWKKKNGLKDLEKARHFIEKYIETVKQKIDYNPIGRETKGTCVAPPTPVGKTEQQHPFGYFSGDEIGRNI